MLKFLTKNGEIIPQQANANRAICKEIYPIGSVEPYGISI
jgi:hypothetical protein